MDDTELKAKALAQTVGKILGALAPLFPDGFEMNLVATGVLNDKTQCIHIGETGIQTLIEDLEFLRYSPDVINAKLEMEE